MQAFGEWAGAVDRGALIEAAGVRRAANVPAGDQPFGQKQDGARHEPGRKPDARDFVSDFEEEDAGDESREGDRPAENGRRHISHVGREGAQAVKIEQLEHGDGRDADERRREQIDRVLQDARLIDVDMRDRQSEQGHDEEVGAADAAAHDDRRERALAARVCGRQAWRLACDRIYGGTAAGRGLRRANS